MDNERDERTSDENLILAYNSINFRAEELIFGDRSKQYSHPIEDFATTAEFWTTWCHSRRLLRPEIGFTPEDIAMMMTLMKVSRESRVSSLDNIVDMCGYVGCLGRVIAERIRRGLGVAYSRLTRRPWE
jgi:hypothetical protein